MTSLILTLSLWATPLLPADIPANAIYLGKGVGLIHSLKLRMGEVMPHNGMVLTFANFVRLKSALEDAPDLCVWAVDQAVNECTKGLDRERDIMLNRETDDQAIIKAYEKRLFATETALQNETNRRQYMMYTALITGAVAIVSTSLLIGL